MSFIVQTAILLSTGVALFFAWRKAASIGGIAGLLVTVGFVGRTVAGLLLFWIAYLELPILSHLQFGKGVGVWFFASDALLYMENASQAASDGFSSIVAFDRSVASAAYTKTLATAFYLVGDFASTALLLNLLLFLGTCIVLGRWAEVGSQKGVRTVAVATVALMPSIVLWSLQPLKDTFFIFLIVVFFAACALWQRSWATQRWSHVAAAGAAMVFALYGLAGVRWYYAFVAFGGCAFFLLLTALLGRTYRRAGLVTTALLVIVLSRAFLFGARPYVPETIERALMPETMISGMAQLPLAAVETTSRVRGGFEATGGATSIQVGAIAGVAHKAVTVPLEPHQLTTPTVAQRRESETESPQSAARQERASSQPRDTPESNVPAEDTPHSVAPANPDGAVVAEHPVTDPAAAQPLSTPAEGRGHLPNPAHAEAPRDASSAPAVVSGPASGASEAVATATHDARTRATPPDGVNPPAPEPAKAAHADRHRADHGFDNLAGPNVSTGGDVASSSATNARMAVSVHAEVATAKKRPTPATPPSREIHPARTLEPGSAKTAKTADAAAPASPAARPARGTGIPEPESAADRPATQTLAMPESAMAKTLLGLTVVLVPRALAQGIGFVQIEGGRGLWAFADLDTLAFDALLIAVMWILFRRRRELFLRNPLLWALLGVTILITAPLVYTITNFGTLFRLREMIVIGVALLPLAVATAKSSRLCDAHSEPRKEQTEERPY